MKTKTETPFEATGASPSAQAAEFAEPPARGRGAKSFRAIPVRGWMDIGFRLFGQMQQDRVGLVAAGAAFFIFLSIVPALAAFVSLYGLLTDPSSLAQQLNALSGLVPSAVLEILRDELARLVSRSEQSLGLSFAFSVALAIWSANKGMNALFQAMNVAYNEQEERNFFHLKALTLLFTLSSMVYGLVLLNGAVLVPLILQLVGLGYVYKLTAGILIPIVILLSGLVGIGALYRWGPSRRPAKWRWLSLGSVGASIGVIAVSAGFAFYLSNFGNYGATYGSLGAVVGLMMWIYLSTYVVILGAEVNAEIEHQTAVDTTIGEDRPLGARNAMVADTVGKAR